MPLHNEEQTRQPWVAQTLHAPPPRLAQGPALGSILLIVSVYLRPWHQIVYANNEIYGEQCHVPRFGATMHCSDL